MPVAILVEGPSDAAKERVLYLALGSMGDAGGASVFVTKSSRAEVERDAAANGVQLPQDAAWVAREGGQTGYNMDNLATLSYSLKEVLKGYKDRRVKIAFDVLSPLLMRNSSEGVYNFLDQLITEVKKYQAVFLVTIEQAMHTPQVLASIEALFDGVISVETAQSGTKAVPVLRVRKMRGAAVTLGESILLSEADRLVEKPPESERKLAAIMFTDIVGYTALTQRNERQALDLLQRHNELLRPIFEKHHGREVKTIGDAFLIEFGSAMEAVLCAVEAQESLFNYDKSAAPEEVLKIRIGIHLGDVVYKEKDVLGDAVNIASRIQPLAGPGGICVSEQVYSQVHNKMSMELLKDEQVKLKNLARPLNVYHIVLPWESRPKLVSGSVEPEVPLKRRLAILPMTNLTQDSQDDYFADGMTEELIMSLSNLRDLRVIARSSVMRYKGTGKTASEIARELNVGSVVEGSIRKAGNKVRVAIQMVDGGTEEQLLGVSYDRELEDIFAVQSDIARQVTKALKAKLRSIEKARLEMKPTESVDAYSLYLKGRFALHTRTKSAMEEAISRFEQAIVLDAGYARALAGLADAHLLMGSYGYSDPKEAYAKARDYVSRALARDEGLAEAHVSLGFLLETFYYDFQGARKEFEKAVSLSPSYAQARHWLAINHAIFGRLDEGVRELEMAQQADPLSPQVATVLGGFYAYLGREEDALFQWQRALRSNPENVPIYLNRSIYFAKVGRGEEARADMQKAVALSGEEAVVKCLNGYVQATLGDIGGALKTLGEVVAISEKQYVSPFYLAILYAAVGDLDNSFKAIGRAIDDRSAEIEALVNDPMFDRVRPDPRFDEALKRAGVPKKERGQRDEGKVEGVAAQQASGA